MLGSDTRPEKRGHEDDLTPLYCRRHFHFHTRLRTTAWVGHTCECKKWTFEDSSKMHFWRRHILGKWYHELGHEDARNEKTRTRWFCFIVIPSVCIRVQVAWVGIQWCKKWKNERLWLFCSTALRMTHFSVYTRKWFELAHDAENLQRIWYNDTTVLLRCAAIFKSALSFSIWDNAINEEQGFDSMILYCFPGVLILYILFTFFEWYTT